MTGRDTTPRSGIELASTIVADAMHARILSCAPDTVLRSVADVMARHRVHMVAVSGGQAEGVWGVVSDLDLVGAALRGRLDDLTAGAIAASPVLRVTPGESLERAAQMMAENETAHLIVVDPVSGQPTGVLSTLDVARALAG